MEKIIAYHKGFFTGERRRSFFVALLLLGLSLSFQYYASLYSIRNAGHFVGDIFLDNVPVVDLNPIIVEGALVAILVSIILILVKPKYLLFSLKAAAVFMAIRAFMVAATHLGIYPNQITPSDGFLDQFYVNWGLEAGYFFSAHTGLPFLMALIFWDEKLWRDVYLAASVLFGAAVLLSHVHYSIDVFAAPFMTYSIFKLAQYLFKDDYKLIHE